MAIQAFTFLDIIKVVIAMILGYALVFFFMWLFRTGNSNKKTK
jgi:flagellar biogenesis protein FliO